MKQNNNESYSLYNSKAENESTDNQKNDDGSSNNGGSFDMTDDEGNNDPVLGG